jgi:hypothetical protein
MSTGSSISRRTGSQRSVGKRRIKKRYEINGLEIDARSPSEAQDRINQGEGIVGEPVLISSATLTIGNSSDRWYGYNRGFMGNLVPDDWPFSATGRFEAIYAYKDNNEFFIKIYNAGDPNGMEFFHRIVLETLDGTKLLELNTSEGSGGQLKGGSAYLWWTSPDGGFQGYDWFVSTFPEGDYTVKFFKGVNTLESTE